MLQAISTASSAGERMHRAEAGLEIVEVAARERLRGLQRPLRDPRQQQRGDAEGDGVHPVREVRAGDPDERAADQRADSPGHVVGGLEERGRVGQLRVVDEVREACVHGRAEEAVGDAGHAREHDDRGRARREGERDEDGEAHEVGADHQPLPLQPVDQGAEEEPDRDGRQEVRDQQPAHPRRRPREVVDVDRERDRGEPGADPRRDRGDEEQAKARCAVQKVELPPERGRGCHRPGDANTCPQVRA